MKILFLLLFSTGVMAQKDTLVTLPMQAGKVFYQKVYQDSATKEQLFLKAKEIFLRSFPNTKDVIQDEDKEEGIIAGKGNFKLSNTPIFCTIRILTKDNKYKLEVFDFYVNEKPIETRYALALKRNSHLRSWQNFNDRVLQMMDQIENDMNKKLSTDF